MLDPNLVKRLAENEQKTLSDWLETRDRRPLSPLTSTKFFELYLHGSSCQEIVKINENLFSLGMVLEARVRDAWDPRKDEYLASLFSGIGDKVRQTQVESVAFISDLLAATNKLHGERVKKFMQSGDIKDLDGVPIGSLQSYQKLVEMLLRLTGQGQSAGNSNKIQIMAQNAVIKAEVGDEKRLASLTPDTAEKVLALLEGKSDR